MKLLDKSKWTWLFLFIITFFVSAIAHAATYNPVLEIQPASNAPITVSSTGVEPTLSYTVTNNTGQSAREIVLNPSYQLNSNFVTVTLLNDTCSGTTILSKGVCHFVVALRGMGAAGDTTLSPRVCKSQGAICSQPLVTDRVAIHSQQTTPVLQAITLAPSSASVSIASTETFTATGHYSDGSQITLSSGITWSSSNTGVATINSSGVATGVSAGSSNITAVFGGVTSNAAVLTVSSITLQSIAIAPTSAQVAIGGQRQFAATGTYSDGSKKSITSSVQWISATPAVATINTAGLATGVTSGTSSITAKIGSITSNAATLTVSAATLQSIAVTPTTDTVSVGLTQQFVAIGTYSDGSQETITNNAQWHTSNAAVATVSAGLATGVSAGTAGISASLSGITSNSASLTVTGVAPLSLLVTPGLFSISTSGTPSQTTQQFTAVARYSDGSTEDVTNQVTWSSSNGSATISSSGVATAVTAGTTSITATLSSVASNNAILTVTSSPITKYFLLWQIPVTPLIPLPVYVYRGDTQVAYIPSASLQVFAGQYIPSTTTVSYQLYYHSSDGWHGCTYSIVNGSPATARNNPCPGETISQNGGGSGATSNVYAASMGAYAWNLVSAPTNSFQTNFTNRTIKIINNTQYAQIQVGESCSTSVIAPCQTTTNLARIVHGHSYSMSIGYDGLNSAAFYLTGFCNTGCDSDSNWTQTGGYYSGQQPYATKIEPTVLTVDSSGTFPVPAGASNIDISSVDGYNASAKLYPDTPQFCTYTVPPEDSNTLGASYYGSSAPLAQISETGAFLSNMCANSSQLYSGYSGGDSPWTLTLTASSNFIGCRSPCSYAKASGQPQSTIDQFCCTGSYSTPGTCIVSSGTIGANTSTYNTNVVNTFQNVYGFAFGDAGSDYGCPPETNFVIEFTAGP